MNSQIPFNKPFLVGKELYYVAQSVLKGQISGDGPYTKACEQLMEKLFGADRILLTTSCTSALEMAAILIDIQPGDEVIIPSFAGSSTANAFMLRGARPVFVDIRSDTLNLDETLIEPAITERTRAIVPRHYAGVASDLAAICSITRRHAIYLIENAAEGVYSTYKETFLGTHGDLGTYSFHETKNIICGEGGALVINNSRFVERAEIIREKGTNRSQFFRGQVDKYTWVDLGSSYVPSDLLAAFLYAQLENIQSITTRRHRIFRWYWERLSPLAEQGRLTLPTVPTDCEPSYHMFYVLLSDEASRKALIQHLRDDGIQAVFHFMPLHTSPMGHKLGYRSDMLPVTEGLSKRLLRLPMYYELEEHDVDKVTESILAFFTH